jgi:uncharacterized protein DUF5666
MDLCRFVSATALTVAVSVACLAVSPRRVLAQDATQQVQRVPLDQVLGTVTAVNAGEKSFTVKEDKTGTEFSVSAASARRFLRVPPGEKDLKKAQPIDATQIAVGDRLLARGHKNGSEPKLDASIVIVMTAGDLQQKHQAESAEWQTRGTHGVVASVDPASHQITMTQRTPDGTKTVAVVTSPNTQFTRYSAASHNSGEAIPSALGDVKVGDQLRVLGTSSEDGTKITADKVWSGSFRTIAATVVSVSPDSKSMKVKDLQTKQPVNIVIADDSSVRRIPPEMAARLATRMNSNAKGGHANGEPHRRVSPVEGEASDGADGRSTSAGNPDEPAGVHGPRGGHETGDLSQMIQRLPKIDLSDLKPGDAVVISGGIGDDRSQLTATSVIAGVEPILASAPSRGQSSALGNWSLDVGVPGQ